jgi:hypothetical protein
MRAIQQRLALNTERNKKISLAHKGKIISTEHRQKLREAHTGRVMTQEDRIKMARAAVLREQRRREARPRIPVVCTYDGRQFESIYGASDSYGVDPNQILKVLCGDYRHTRGLSFSYLNPKHQPGRAA